MMNLHLLIHFSPPKLKHYEVVPSLNKLTNLEELHLLGFWNTSGFSGQSLAPIKTIKILHLKMDHFFPKMNFQAIFPHLIRINICGPTGLLEEAKKHFEVNPISAGTVISYVAIKDKEQYMQPHHRAEYEKHLAKYEKYLVELERLEDDLYWSVRTDYEEDDDYE